MTIVFSERAVADVIAADDWWRANRDSRELFAKELAAAVLLLETSPRVGQRVRAMDEEREVRRLVLRKCRYLVFYEVGEGVAVLRVWHPSRRPADLSP